MTLWGLHAKTLQTKTDSGAVYIIWYHETFSSLPAVSMSSSCIDQSHKNWSSKLHNFYHPSPKYACLVVFFSGRVFSMFSLIDKFKSYPHTKARYLTIMQPYYPNMEDNAIIPQQYRKGSNIQSQASWKVVGSYPFCPDYCGDDSVDLNMLSSISLM